MRTSFLILLFVLASEANAVDTKFYEEQCLKIGFKKGSIQYGDCVLRLLDSSPRVRGDDIAESARERVRAREDLIALEEQLAAEKRQYEKKQKEIMDLQRRQTEAAESMAREQRRSNGLRQLQSGLEMMQGGGSSSGSGTSSTAIRTPSGRIIHCNQSGNFTNCF